MQSLGVPFVERDLGRQPLSEAELRALVGDRSPLAFLNPRNELYRARGMKAQPPTPEEAVRLMAEHPNLLRRPLLVNAAGEVIFGFDENAYRRIAGAS